MTNQTANFVAITPGPLLRGDTTFRFEVNKDLGGSFIIPNQIFKNNLIMVDGLMPEILFHLILLSSKTNCYSLAELAANLEVTNPLGYPLHNGLSFYKHKMKNLLKCIAFGMDASTVWFGEPNVYDHYPVLKNGKDLVYYIDKDFLEILFSKISLAKIESDGNLYEIDGETYFDMNFQLIYNHSSSASGLPRSKKI